MAFKNIVANIETKKKTILKSTRYLLVKTITYMKDITISL